MATVPQEPPQDSTQAPNDPVALRFPKGVNNRSRETALPDGALRVATNLDVTNMGGLLSRRGLRKVVDGECHSLWTHPGDRFALLVRNGELVRLGTDETAVSLTSVSGPVVYAVLNDDVYWTDGVAVGRVDSTGAVGVWGLNNPPDPVCSPAASGGLFAGTYQVAMTVKHPSGIESGATRSVSVAVAEGGGIQVIAPVATGIKFILYRTPPNGSSDELMQQVMVEPGSTTILGVGLLGNGIDSLFASRPLPGQCLTAFKGRLWGAVGNVVWFTSDKSPHWFFPSSGYFQYEQLVSVLSPTEDGIYVGLPDQIYFLQGTDPFKMTQRAVSSVGAAKNSSTELPYDTFMSEGGTPARQGVFYDTDGFLCIGKPGGAIIRPTQAQFSAGNTQQGATTYRAQEGLRQVVAVLQCETGPQTATDTVVGTVFPNGVVLNAH